MLRHPIETDIIRTDKYRLSWRASFNPTINSTTLHAKSRNCMKRKKLMHCQGQNRDTR